MDMNRARKMATEERGMRSSMAWVAWEQKRGPAYMLDQLINEVDRLTAVLNDISEDEDARLNGCGCCHKAAKALGPRPLPLPLPVVER
jgi:hypothetical protein